MGVLLRLPQGVAVMNTFLLVAILLVLTWPLVRRALHGAWRAATIVLTVGALLVVPDTLYRLHLLGISAAILAVGYSAFLIYRGGLTPSRGL
jgi:hypothetical protein